MTLFASGACMYDALKLKWLAAGRSLDQRMAGYDWFIIIARTLHHAGRASP